MDISTRPGRTLVQDDQTWLGNGGQPIGKPRSIVLDRDLFNLAGTFTDGYIPSGVVLGKVTATGKYGPYGGLSNEVQTINLGAASAGTVTITFQGSTTGPIAYNASVATVQAALDALPNINPGDVVVSGGPWPATDLTLTFGGQYVGVNVAQITADGAGATGETITIATATAGGAAVSDLSTAAGLLFAAVPYDRTSTGDMGAALFWNGEVLTDNLPANSGVDSNADGDLPHIQFVPLP